MQEAVIERSADWSVFWKSERSDRNSERSDLDSRKLPERTDKSYALIPQSHLGLSSAGAVREMDMPGYAIPSALLQLGDKWR